MPQSDGKTYVYFLTNQHGNVMYVGCADDLKNRIYFHKKRLIAGFTKRYNVHKLVYYEAYDRAELAYLREAQLKKFRREKKNNLVEKFNPSWLDLSKDLWR
jgi:putative endonuclease